MCFVVAVYFKRSKIKNAHYLRVKGPAIIAMNHPNAFMDAIAFTAMIYPPRVRYLARGDAFKKGIVTALLESLGIIPIFRIQDGGKEGLKKNDETYDKVNALLNRNQKIIIFAEGLCIQERRLRPLKKGVPRMVFGAMDAYPLKDLVVIPIGVNYSNPTNFRSNLFYNIGKPIPIHDYMASYKVAPAKAMNRFLADLTPRMKELIININHPKSEKVIAHLEEICKYDFFNASSLNPKNLEHDFLFSSTITETINCAEEQQPEKVRLLEEKTTHYMNELAKYDLKDWLMIPEKQRYLNGFYFLLRVLCMILTLPLYLVGLIGNYIPYKVTEYMVSKKVKLAEFKASFAIGIGAMLVLLFYVLQVLIAQALLPSIWWALFMITLFITGGAFCLFMSPFRKKTWGIYRLLKLKSKQPNIFERLSLQRITIIKEFESLP